MRNIHKRLIAHILACLYCVLIVSVASAQTLTEQLDTILKDPALDHGLQGVLIRSLKTNTTLYEHNADCLMTPASNLKLLVSATACGYAVNVSNTTFSRPYIT